MELPDPANDSLFILGVMPRIAFHHMNWNLLYFKYASSFINSKNRSQNFINLKIFVIKYVLAVCYHDIIEKFGAFYQGHIMQEIPSFQLLQLEVKFR